MSSTAKIRRPSLFHQALESRWAAEMYTTFWSMPLLNRAPRGDGHPVLVLPGFLASGTSTFMLRYYLKHLGYAGHRWKLGRNLGPVGEKEHEVLERLTELRRRYNRKVSLVGWSLGGIYARELAWMAPEDVRQVITLGTPIRHARAVTVSWLYEDVTGQRESHMDPDLLARVPEPPPVPSTTVYSRTDGVVPWQCAIDKEAEQTENVRVEGSHIGLGFHPAVLWVIADRLAQPEGEWRPFNRKGIKSLVYPRPDRLPPGI